MQSKNSGVVLKNKNKLQFRPTPKKQKVIHKSKNISSRVKSGESGGRDYAKERY